MKYLLALLLLFTTSALAQTTNPDTGDVWTYYGPTLGSGWGPPTSGLSRDGTNAINPDLRLNVLPAPTTPGNVLSSNGTDWVSSGSAVGANTNLSNVTLPTAPNNLLGNSVAHTYFAKAYGNCSWATDGTGDNSICILLAITSALADVVTDPTTFFRTGGGEVILPDGNIGIASTILQNTSPAITLRGAGGPGSFGYCKTQLKWTGAAGGTMVQFGDDANAVTVGGGLDGICLVGATVGIGTGAGTGLKIRSGAHAAYRDFFIYNVQTAGIDINVSAVSTQGVSFNTFRDGGISLQSAGAINATGVLIGAGTATQDTFANTFENVAVQHQNGDGWICGNSDTNFFRNIWGQNIFGGTGKGLRLNGSAGGPSNLSECRENWFSGYFPGGVSAETNTFPSFGNYVLVMGMGSGAPLPTVNGNATLSYDTDTGIHFDNRSGATTFTHGGMTYKATPGATGAVFDIDTANASNSATVAKFGTSLPVYLMYNNPNIGYNLYWNGTNWAYGKGSSAKYGALEGFNPTTGGMQWSTSTATGNANASATLTTTAVLDLVGNYEPSGHITLKNTKILLGRDSGGTQRSLIQMSGGNQVVVDGGAGGLLFRTNNTSVTVGSVDASGNWTYNHDLIADSIKAANSSSASHTINNSGTNTDVNAPTGGNMDLRVGNTTILRATSAGASMQVGTLTVPTPSGTTDAVNKAYADSIASGIITHASANAATTANLTATYANGASGVGATLTNSGTQVAFAVDGYSASVNDRILVKDQTTAFQNGIYTVTTVGTGATNWVLTRATDFDAASGSEVAAGASIIVVGGTVGAKTQWVETGQGPFTIGATAIIFSQTVAASSSGTVSAGTTSQLGYYATNGTTISGLATGNNGILVTNSSGVPSISSTIPNATQDSIIRTGTIGVGVWNGTIVAQQFGGSGADLSGTGGASQVLKQVSIGAPVTVGTLACADLSDDAASCSIDTTNATNISSGTVAAARGGAGTINGALKGNGSGLVSQAACADLSNGAAGCSTATGTSGAVLPLLNGTNTASGVNTFSNTTDATSVSAAAVVMSGGLGVAKSIYTTGAITSLGGSLRTTGSLPTVATCGTSPSVAGTNVAGRITIGSGTVTACTLNFTASFWAAAPACVITPIGSTAGNMRFTSISATSAVIAITASGNTGINYVCVGI